MRVIVAVARVITMAGCADVEQVPAPIVVEPVDDFDATNVTVVETAPEKPLLAQRANLTIDGGVTIKFNGTGWGRLQIAAPGGSLAVRVVHDTWDDLTLFSDDGAETYDDGYNHTFISLGRPLDFTRDESFTWQRWGTPGWGIWPTGSAWDEWDHTTLSYNDGETLHVVVSTTVPGYSFQIGDGGLEIEWALAEHANVAVAWPEASDDAAADIGVAEAQRSREWRTTLVDQPPSYLMARGYTRSEGSIEAGVEGDRKGWESSRAEQLVPLTPFPSYRINSNGHSASTSGSLLLETATLDGFRLLETTKVKAVESEEYGGFLAIPLQ